VPHASCQKKREQTGYGERESERAIAKEKAREITRERRERERERGRERERVSVVLSRLPCSTPLVSV
jgi:nitric oxide reductase activation protein